jgi:ribonuclease Z
VSSYAVRFTDSKIWLLDCGEGTQHQVLKTDLVKLNKIEVIFVTHLHGDHSFGLPGLLASMSLLAERGPLKVIGPQGLDKMINTALSLSASYITYPLEIVELEENKVKDLGNINGFKVQAYPLKHKVACFGYVVTEPEKPGKLDAARAKQLGAQPKDLGQLKAGKDITLADGTVVKSSDVLSPPAPGKKIVMLGDTCNSDSLLEDGMGCDVVIHETTYHAELKEKAIAGGHSTSQMAGEFAARLKAKKLIITHFSQRYSTATGPDEITVEHLVKEAQHECPDTAVLAAADLQNFDI